jgi:hypothetical protein
MMPDERQRLIRASMVDDLTLLPKPLVDRLRLCGDELMREPGLLDPGS